MELKNRKFTRHKSTNYFEVKRISPTTIALNVMNNKDNVVKEIFTLYETYGRADYIGEPVSQIEHMSQAASLAIDEGYDDEVVLAAFFHDIGHICVISNAENKMGGFGTKSHEKIALAKLDRFAFVRTTADIPAQR